ncbi:hypothetical protein ERAQ111492_08610 [Erysipelothrix aquatica]|uniref:hypothetical protein n=1 Tax=Erysipelothrix aquatica TaxID=2683714 RepID=UPI001356F3BE|nr:hypothetical protein [Erysipelothrix aquatica]
MFKAKGKRIKASDKQLVYHFFLTSTLLTFLVILISFHLKALLAVDWQIIRLEEVLSKIQTSYFIASVTTGFFVCFILVLLFYHYRIDKIKELQHRQKLARMILQNGWYESKQVQSEGFFKDLSSTKVKEKISHFPKMYYLLKEGLIRIRVEITMSIVLPIISTPLMVIKGNL